MIHICVEGTKGAGKTTAISGLIERLRGRGWIAESHAVFHEANDWACTHGFAGAVPMMEAGADENEAVVDWIVGRDAEVRREFSASHSGATRQAVLVSDRGWITLHAYLYCGAWAKLSSASGEISTRWERALASAPATFFLSVSPGVTAARRAGQLDAVSGLQTESRLASDYERRIMLADEHHQIIVRRWDTSSGPWPDIVGEIETSIVECHERQI